MVDRPRPVPEPDVTAPRPVTGDVAATATPPVTERPPRWGLGDVVLGWLLAQVGGAITGLVVLELSGQDFDDLSLGWLAIGQVGLWLGFFGVPLVATRLKGNGLVVDLGLRFQPMDSLGLIYGVAAQISINLLIFGPLLWLTDRTDEDLTAPARDLADRADDPFGVLMLLLIVGIGAPIFEEIFYRGLMQRSLERRFGPVWAVGVTSVVFGLSHFQLLQAPGLIAFGVVVGILAVRTGRLGPSIVTHVGFNLLAVVTLLAVD